MIIYFDGKTVAAEHQAQAGGVGSGIAGIRSGGNDQRIKAWLCRIIGLQLAAPIAKSRQRYSVRAAIVLLAQAGSLPFLNMMLLVFPLAVALGICHVFHECLLFGFRHNETCRRQL